MRWVVWGVVLAFAAQQEVAAQTEPETPAEAGATEAADAGDSADGSAQDSEGSVERPPGEPTDPSPSTQAPAPQESVAPAAAARAQSRNPEPRRAPPPDEPPVEEEELDEDEDDGDRTRLFYVEASAGYTWANLGVVRNDNLVPEIQRLEGHGYALGAGAGFFIKFLTLGLVFEFADHDAFDLGTLTLDLGIRIPTPFIEPYLRVGIGYAWMFGLEEFREESDSPIRGVAVDLGAGFDFQISDLVAIGIGVDVALFNVRRSGVDGAPTSLDIELGEDGDAIGVNVSGLASVSFHF